MKKLFFIAALGVAGMMSAKGTSELCETKSVRDSELSSNSITKSMTCIVTITVRNRAGQITGQWNEYYTVCDWCFYDCDQIGRQRVKELSAG